MSISGFAAAHGGKALPFRQVLSGSFRGSASKTQRRSLELRKPILGKAEPYRLVLRQSRFASSGVPGSPGDDISTLIGIRGSS